MPSQHTCKEAFTVRLSRHATHGNAVSPYESNLRSLALSQSKPLHRRCPGSPHVLLSVKCPPSIPAQHLASQQAATHASHARCPSSMYRDFWCHKALDALTTERPGFFDCLKLSRTIRIDCPPSAHLAPCRAPYRGFLTDACHLSFSSRQKAQPCRAVERCDTPLSERAESSVLSTC